MAGGEVGAEVALIELHAFDEVEGGFGALGFFNGDHAVFANLVHGVGQQLADFGIVVGGDGANLGDLVVVLDLGRELGDGGNTSSNGLVDAALDVGRVGTGGR